MSYSRWKTLRERKLAGGFTEPEDVAEARREIRLSMALAKAVYERRTELGLTQAELAERAGLTKAKVSRIEGSDTVPTLPLLAKLAEFLGTTLNIALDNHDNQAGAERAKEGTRTEEITNAIPEIVGYLSGVDQDSSRVRVPSSPINALSR